GGPDPATGLLLLRQANQGELPAVGAGGVAERLRPALFSPAAQLTEPAARAFSYRGDPEATRLQSVASQHCPALFPLLVRDRDSGPFRHHRPIKQQLAQAAVLL